MHYLAIVTLAFGEIVKNVMNACYLGVDSHGLHFSLKDSASLNLEVDGKVLINGAMGITGIKKRPPSPSASCWSLLRCWSF